jgi:hypothetical protein
MAVMMTVFFGSVVIPHFAEPGIGIDRVVFSIMVLVLTGVVLALHPRRGELLTTGRRISKPMAAFGVIGLAVAAAYALDQIQVQLATDLATDPHSAPGKEHWAEMASAALTLPLIALVAAPSLMHGRVSRASSACARSAALTANGRGTARS